MPWQPRFGPAWTAPGRVRFRIWAPASERAEVVFDDGQRVVMRRHPNDTFTASVGRLRPGTRYRIGLDGDGPFPDPWSRWQPDGVHGSSALLRPATVLAHRPVPRGVAQATYELHIGTFSVSGDYVGAARHLAALRRLGVDTIQVMPVAEFPGRWNWGYDGAFLHAPTRAYGTPDQLRAFVARAHRARLSVILDVVYNHLGPDGAYIHRFAPSFFTDVHRTPWGGAIDYHRPEVRQTVADAARWWIQEYGFDGLRLDATHAIIDESDVHILADVATAARRAYRNAYVVAEDHRNERRLFDDHKLDAILADDFHHAVRVALTGEKDAYFADYRGSAVEVATAIADGWIHRGQRLGPAGPGTPTDGLEAERFIFCIENHDQVGNRAAARHLAALVGPAEFRAASALLMLAPERVMLFQGQEFGSTGHFHYFTDHGKELGRQVTQGRRREFRHFSEFRDHPELIPDPQLPGTFARSRLDRSERAVNRTVVALYGALFRLRGNDPVLSRPDRGSTRAWAEGQIVHVERWNGRGRRLLLATLTGDPGAKIPPGRVLLHTDERRFGGAGRATLATPGAVLLELP
ncbi:MAG: malto-oligosyltrehalose trehalohydrolase [Candidatus Dormibacteraceae bacterium]